MGPGKRVWGLLKKIKDGFTDWLDAVKKADRLGEAAEAATSCATNSFTPTTKVVMADGSTKSIQDVDIGDKVLATDLRPGQWLRTSTGTYVQVTAVKRSTQHASVRNLTVAGVHTYYVVAGTAPALMHNCGEGDGYLYRGVPNGHSKYGDALEGRSVPHGGHSDPGRHAGGNTDSEFTSWTHDYDGVALMRLKSSDRVG
ncbi:Hint domain-containing homing endonuclease [Streptomyces violens]|uniref:Hint domain-containing homing endonuclease n=1 Tax=Streptomyces violens TaxID=66377 RepID=UPI0004BF4A1A|nr:Hint domain-containing homing endonuclease [Streptomyces violens]